MDSPLARLRRDVTTVVRGLLGHTPPPLHPRRARPPAPAATQPLATRSVVIDALHRETADAVSLTLRDPTGAPLPFTAGQFFTLDLDLDGERLRRAYSASSDPSDPTRITITVKRIAGGRASSFLTERAAPGLTLQLRGPSGDFTVAPTTAAQHLVAIVGGSGITPVMAIAREVLARRPATRLTLIYGNRDRAAIIFASELEALATAHPDRLTIDHVLDDDRGPLTAATITDRLAALAVVDDDATLYLVCGPTAMLDHAHAALAARGVAPTRICTERFLAPARAATVTAAQPLTIRRAGVTTRAIVRPGDTVLEAGLAAGAPLAFSCTMGGCGACAVTLVDGAVTMDEPNCLTAGERARGRILACVARPTAPSTVEVEA